MRSLIEDRLTGPVGLNARFWPVRYNISRQTVEHEQPTSRREMIAMTLASASPPIYTEPVRYDGDLYVDGGVRDLTPLRLLVDHASDVDRALAINLERYEAEPEAARIESIEDLISEVVMAMTRDIFVNDVVSYKRLNAMGMAGVEDPLDGEVPTTYIPTTWIEPDEQLPPALDFSVEAKQRTTAVMRRAADRVIERG